MQKNIANRDKTLYKTPFSKAYWIQAASEFKRLDVLIFAALSAVLFIAGKIIFAIQKRS